MPAFKQGKLSIHEQIKFVKVKLVKENLSSKTCSLYTQASTATKEPGRACFQGFKVCGRIFIPKWTNFSGDRWVWCKWCIRRQPGLQRSNELSPF